MVLTPLEIYNKEFGKSLRGYKEDEVDSFIDKVLADYEKLYKENMDLKEAVENNHNQLSQYKKMEETLHNSIIVAQQTAEEVKKVAEERAELLDKQAEQRAREIITEAEEKAREAYQAYQDIMQRINQFKLKQKSILQAQLEFLENDKLENEAAVD